MCNLHTTGSAGHAATSIHGDRTQWEREQALKDFKTGKMRVLVATEVAARGLDVDNVTHVINYELPTEFSSYVHRIGRTGRAGNTGTATAYFNEKSNAPVAKDFAKFLRDSKQPVPDFIANVHYVNSKMKNRRWGGGGNRRGGGGFGGGRGRGGRGGGGGRGRW
jgi:ATP-dependent RNA helicase DDX3X